mmetsp:Transcript_19121/g.31682  ORF Transcript_19121/g.31682 Transcript_19121/m.31682 type:complete len:1223 (-) Transcript_19121:156-3824(-)|eukprot:CAMPEP_0119012602 /NCGR_PEP_ID=MMETSP1176-20130426/7048_1 /TAXON_ID=265551 /ORGANISM="Synedropsis recta cf, Strain CCMP1620" /LENGTH=1222 /DNA_ID=CAMNT_0006965595 /DNA_START=100 /DNA_END=3768 /DNA_ORIENTATION=+
MSGNGSYQKNGGSYAAVPGDSNVANADNNTKSKWIKIGLAAAVLAAVGYFGYTSIGSHSTSTSPSALAAQSDDLSVTDDGSLKLFDKQNRYVLEDFDAKPTFSNFLPGVAGFFGKPVWSFYVNRGQGMASFGTQSKEYPILEFNAANKAYQVTPFIGFRSFVRGTRDLMGSSFETEPFSPATSRNLALENEDSTKLPKRIMYVGANEMEVQEFDTVNQLQVQAKYFVLPEEDFSSLVRRATYTNTGSTDLQLSILDGLAKMEPSGGMLDWSLKQMGRTLEGWMGVYHADDGLTMPFYKMSTEPGDSASVKIEKAGHYCLAFVETDGEDAAELLPIVFDTAKVFGQSTSLEHPAGLHASSVSDIVAGPQYGDAKTSSAFAAIESVTLKAGENITIATFYGKAEHVEEVPKIAKLVTQAGYVQSKFERARTLINELTAAVETNTANPLFNGVITQMFLDNSLRGGMPTILGNVDGDTNYDEDDSVKIFHAFSRIHGDLERDYNAFSIQPAYFSQGPGNYRDIAQNRRDDVTFLPKLGAYDVKMFLAYIQADGYEPLTVEAVAYMFEDQEETMALATKLTSDANSAEILKTILIGGAFRPGQLFELVDELQINITDTNEDFLNYVVAEAIDRPMAVYGSGYWADHWDYYLDLIEAYTAIYPDGVESLMFDTELRYFFSTATVKPRSDKYVLTYTFDGTSKHVLQLDSTYFDDDKVAEQEAFKDSSTGLIGIDANWQRTNEGQAFKSSPIAKLFLLGAIKFAMRDAYGMGIEYEGGRPGWNDAMNGLPGMVGSGMPETYEMYLTLEYVRDIVKQFKRPVVVPDELFKMITTVNGALDTLDASGYTDSEEMSFDVPEDLFNYWDIVAAARESYRNDVQYYFSGNETSIPAKTMVTMLDRWIAQTELGMERAMKMASTGDGDDGDTGIAPCYFSFDITKWKKNGGKNSVGLPTVNALAMTVGRFPLFLEGPVRYMKTIQDDKEKMKDMYQRVLTSGLRDEKLNMYFLSASLKGQSYDMGRMMAFSPGWLENQSIWTHMSFKYYLQLLRGQLYEEFFDEMRGGGMMPFMDPDVYGRSLMECSSFMASSAFPDPSMHGRGFLARLSGSTAEFMSMYKLMFLGPEPFFLNDSGDVEMKLVVALPEWLFEDEENAGTRDDDDNLTINFMLFGKIPVTYHKSVDGDLFGVNAKGYLIKMKDGSAVHVDGPSIPTDTAIAIRRVRSVESIDAYF